MSEDTTINMDAENRAIGSTINYNMIQIGGVECAQKRLKEDSSNGQKYRGTGQ